jgi:hypothetical protein
MGREEKDKRRNEGMSSAEQKKPLKFQGLLDCFKQTVDQIEDKRTGENKRYKLRDVYLSALSLFYFQSGSFLAYQKHLEAGHGSNNVKTLFGVKSIPSDNHIRDMLDKHGSLDEVGESITKVVEALHQHEQLTPWYYNKLGGGWLLTFDGVNFHSSKAIHCEGCQYNQKTGSYTHSMVTPVLVKPEYNKVMPLAPEFVRGRGDGDKKGGCEITAAKRWLEKHGERYRQWGEVTVLGDDLYAHQPWCKALLEAGYHFVLVCKPTSHKTLYDWLTGLEKIGGIKTKEVKRGIGRHVETDHYRYANGLALREGQDGLLVNWCELESIDASGKRTYYNTWICDREITSDNVEGITEAGRARWKVENENNNTLKRQGYCLEHNFGHGKQHLANVLATLNIFAFLLHTVQELLCEKYRAIRKKLGARRTLFEHLKTLTAYIVFDSWDKLLDFIMKHLNLKPG